MTKYRIGVEDFRKEFGRYVEENGLTIIEKEIGPSPGLGEVVVVEGIGPKEFRHERLENGLSYCTWSPLVFKKGEDVTGVKGVGDEYVLPVLRIENMKSKQRHVRSWHLAGSGIMASTIHDEPSPSSIIVHPYTAIKSHFTKGSGDYASGTEGFWKELEELGV